MKKFAIVLMQSIEDSQQSISIKRVVSIAHRFHLTAYDAEYLDTAIGQQLPLATLDQKLKEAAERAGVPLLS